MAPQPTAEVDADRSAEGSLRVIAANGERVVAVGPGSEGPVVWTSQAGAGWQILDAVFVPESRGFHAVIDDLAWDGERLVAVGGYENSGTGYAWAPIRVAVWVSVDGGTTWQLGDEVDVALGEPGIDDTPLPSPVRLAAFGSSFVVVGNDAIPTDQEINTYVQHARNAAVWMVELEPAGE
jgi:hypothetical protein